jgi:hypothetical protein
MWRTDAGGRLGGGQHSFSFVRPRACVRACRELRVKSRELDLEDESRHITKWCNYSTELSIFFCP